MDITEVIRSEAQKWINNSRLEPDTIQEVNNGRCKQFAKGVRDTFDKPVKIREYAFDDGYSSYAHAWIEYKGRHYDAECPEGVNNPENLPFFERNGIQEVTNEK